MGDFPVGRYVQALGLGLLAGLVIWWALPPMAQASIHTYYERPGQVTYRSRQSFRDDRDRAWQVIAFQRWQDNRPPSLYLRLVGFPGLVTINPHQPLTLMTTPGQRWQLPVVVDPQTPVLPANARQYDASSILMDLHYAQPLDLAIPLEGADPAIAKLAPFIVREWLQVKQWDPSSSPIGASLGK